MPFTDPERRAEKFKQHGSEFVEELGATMTEVAYEALADRFLYGPMGPHTRECIRRNGERLRYNELTEEFGVVRIEGIATYFKPDPDDHDEPNNLEYFRRTCRE